jgi:hypothetical protein
MLRYLFFILLISVSAFTQSYEGTIGKYPVWFDLIVPDTNGAVKGSYFYKKHKKGMNLQGSKNGQNLQLTETDVKKAITGYFDCKYFGDSIKGTWSKKQGKAPSLNIVAYKTNPRAREYFKTDALEDLPLSDGRTFRDELERFSKEMNEHAETSEEKLVPEISCCQTGNFLTLDITWQWSSGPYPDGGTWGRYLYDLKAKREIDFYDQIAPEKRESFSNGLCTEFQKQLNAYRKRYPDSEWIQPLTGWLNGQDDGPRRVVTTHTVDSIFSTISCRNTGQVSGIDNSGVELLLCEHYFYFPHVIQGMDFLCTVKIPFTELDSCLKLDSPLRELNKKQNDNKK